MKKTPQHNIHGTHQLTTLRCIPHVSRITIGRLYNLGSYEHIRYEISADIPQGHSAQQAFKKLLAILRDLDPKSPVSGTRYRQACDQLQNTATWCRNIADDTERKRVLKDLVSAAKVDIKAYEAWRKKQVAAMALLDQIGGSKTYKDAKEDWDDNY